jgi:hypothetical protein
MAGEDCQFSFFSGGAKQEEEIQEKAGSGSTGPGIEGNHNGADFFFPEGPQGGIFLSRPGIESQGKNNGAANIPSSVLDLHL